MTTPETNNGHDVRESYVWHHNGPEHNDMIDIVHDLTKNYQWVVIYTYLGLLSEVVQTTADDNY